MKRKGRMIVVVYKVIVSATRKLETMPITRWAWNEKRTRPAKKRMRERWRIKGRVQIMMPTRHRWMPM